MVVGEAGIGKTTLLRHAADAAKHQGLRVLRAEGGEFERSLPYGVVLQLFAPLARDGRLAAEMLTGPAAAAGPLLGLAARGPSEHEIEERRDPLAYLHGLFWLTLNLAERRPVVIVVDDAQWSDEPSLRYVHRLLQSADEVPVLVLLAMRPESVSPASVTRESIAIHRAVVRLAPEPLSEAAVGRLVADRAQSSVDSQLQRACWQATRGNPFLVTELAAELARRPREAGAVDAMGALVPEGVGRFVQKRLAAGGSNARGLAEATAVLGESATLRRAAHLAGIDEQTAEAAARWLVAAAIFEDTANLGFRHPIVRSGVDTSIPGPVRAALHRRAADLLADEGADIAVIGAHLRGTEAAADPRTVQLLRASAADAIRRGEAETSITLLERALVEPPGPDERGEVLVDLARARARVRSPDAIAAYLEAIELLDDRLRRAELLLEVGHAHVRAANYAAAAVRFRQGIDELQDVDDPLHGKLEAGLVASSWMGGNDEAADAIGLRILSQPFFGSAHRELVASVAFQRSITGTATCHEMVALVDRILAEAPIERLVDEGQLVQLLTGVLFSSDELERHRALCTAAIAAAEACGDYAKVGLFASARGWSDYFTGRLDDAVSDTEAALRAGKLGWEVFLPAAVGIQAMAWLERGELDAAEAVLALDPDPWSSRADWLVCLVARARLSAARGQIDRARTEFQDAAAFGERFGYRNPGPPAWRRWQAEVLARSGEHAEAIRVADQAVEIAEAWGASWPLGAALWSKGVAARGQAGIDVLRSAVALLDVSPSRLEQARAVVELGSALRRNGTLIEARATLARGANLSHQIGARALLDRATAELASAGGRPRRIALTGVGSLTPAELRVAREAAAGRTNREIAQALFVTPKAVEFHLANTYRKLGIGGRSELPAAIGGTSAG